MADRSSVGLSPEVRKSVDDELSRLRAAELAEKRFSRSEITEVAERLLNLLPTDPPSSPAES